MVNSSDFSKRLQRILEFYGITATAFSEKIEVNRSTISHLLSGRNKPSLEFVMKVIKTFDEVDLYWLLNGKGSFPSGPKNLETDTSIHSPYDYTSLKTDLKPQNREEIIQNQDKTIDRIVVFYSDGTFNAYKNEED